MFSLHLCVKMLPVPVRAVGAGVLITLSTVSACRTTACFISPLNLSHRRLFASRPTPILRMSARDDEMRRLREENEQLRRKLESKDSDTFDLNKLKDRVSSALSSALEPFGLGKSKIQKQDTSPEAMVDKMLRDFPFPIRAFGGLIKGVVGMASEAMKGAAGDIDRIRDLTTRTVSRNSEVIAEFGKDIEIDAPFSQAYSSSSINGKTNKSISLRMPIRGRGSSGIVAVDANIDGQDIVQLSRCIVQVRGQIIEIETRGGGGGDGRIIDVEAKWL